MSDFDHRAALKGIYWELAKGHLRALVAVDGSVSSVSRDENGKYRYQIVQEAVDSFVKAFEDDGLHE